MDIFDLSDAFKKPVEPPPDPLDALRSGSYIKTVAPEDSALGQIDARLADLGQAQKAVEDAAEKVSRNYADDNRAKRRKFFFKFLDAVAVALITLAIEHFGEILAFFRSLFG